jgi:hypothetical protein
VFGSQAMIWPRQARDKHNRKSFKSLKEPGKGQRAEGVACLFCLSVCLHASPPGRCQCGGRSGTQRGPAENTTIASLFSSFPLVCPEPVLVESSFSVSKNGSPKKGVLYSAPHPSTRTARGATSRTPGATQRSTRSSCSGRDAARPLRWRRGAPRFETSP